MTKLSKTFILLLIAGSGLLLSSFTKPSGGHRIKSDYFTDSDTMFIEYTDFTYDSIGRVETEIYTSYSFDRVSPPKANPSTTYYTEYRHDSLFQGKLNNLEFQYKLNAKGYRAGGTHGNTYEYDANGFYINSGEDEGVERQTIANGDIIGRSFFSKDSSDFFITTYTYYPEIDPRDFGFDPEGKRSTHLLKHKSGRGIYGNTLNVAYTYEYDDQHRIIKEIARNRTKSFTHIYTYFD